MRLFLCGLLSTFVIMTAFGQRKQERINFDWKFTHGNVNGAEQVSFDDSDWKTVHLPHDASISGPFVKDSLHSDRKNGFLPRRKGWYRKTLNIDEPVGDQKLSLEFEGVYRDAKVYLNGNQLAHELNGYENFLVDISEEVKQGRNVLAVSYDNTDMNSSRWYNGEGIYRDVWLRRTNPIHVNYNGTYITTPNIKENKASVNVQTEIKNERETETEVTLHSIIVGPSGDHLDTLVSIVPLKAGELYKYDQSTEVANPKLWDLDSPHLYHVKTEVIAEGQQVDDYKSTFGIREVTFDPQQGLLLNGEKVVIKGVNIHHDLGPLGAAAFERGYERRLEGLKELGVNGIRLAHNPHDEYILRWCDRNGILVMDEPFDKWEDQFFGEGQDFDKHWKSSLKKLIRRDRNHPSVFMWSVGNEPKQQKSAEYDFGVPQLKEMVAYTHQLEPTRKVTCGLHPSREGGAYRTENYYREGPPEMEFYMDVVSTNYREEFWGVDKANYPQLTFILSEAQAGNLGNEWFNFNHANSVGLFYWGGTDYIGESFGWPSKGWANGIIDWNDHWKPFSFYIHSLFSEEPMAYIAAYDPGSERSQYWNEVQLRYQPMYDHWNWHGKDSVTLLTFSNGEAVELFLNGKSMGTKQVPEEYMHPGKIKGYTAEKFDPENPVNTGPEIHKNLEWTIPYEPGTIRAVTKIDGEAVASYKMKTAGEPYKIELKADRDTINADGLDLSYITVNVVDENGIVVPDADHNIEFSVKGAGTNVAVSNADVMSDESFVSDNRKVFQGKALLVVRAQREAGKITVKASCKGIKNENLTIRAK